MTIVTGTIQQRHDTAANWMANNPRLLVGEVGFETDTKKRKTGDGVTLWNALSYDASGIASVVGTANRISVNNTDPLNPVINIDSDYDTAITSAISSAVIGKEDVYNKQTDLTASATKYPTVDAVNAGLAIKSNINPRVHSLSSSTSYTLDLDTYDQASITALSGNITINAPTGTVADGRIISYRILDNGTARSVTLNAIFVDLTSVMFTSTTIGKACIFMARYASSRTKYEILAVVVES